MAENDVAHSKQDIFISQHKYITDLLKQIGKTAHSKQDIFISQYKYIIDLLKQTAKTTYKPTTTPVDRISNLEW